MGTVNDKGHDMSTTTALHRRDQTGSADRSAASTPRLIGEPEPSTAMSESNIIALGAAVAEDGLAAHAVALFDLARAAAFLVPVSASVLASVREPEVARLRAFARVSAALVNSFQSARA